jgi:hypothetical protein
MVLIRAGRLVMRVLGPVRQQWASAASAALSCVPRYSMAERRLRYSERKQIAETGGLPDLVHDEVPLGLRNAVRHLVVEAASGRVIGSQFMASFRREAVLHFGFTDADTVDAVLAHGGLGTDDFLDLMEILVEVGATSYGYTAPGPVSSMSPTRRGQAQGLPEVEPKLNVLFERHRFGYVIENGEARKVGSPALSDVVVGPALLAAQHQGWEEVERSYREALNHQRGGADERDDALTAANAALEAALKAAGYQGTHLGPLAADFKARGPVSQLAGVPDALDALIKRSGAIRHVHGDAHGKPPGAEEVPQALADLAVYWAGAFIVFLAETLD